MNQQNVECKDKNCEILQKISENELTESVIECGVQNINPPANVSVKLSISGGGYNETFTGWNVVSIKQEEMKKAIEDSAGSILTFNCQAFNSKLSRPFKRIADMEMSYELTGSFPSSRFLH